MIKTANAAFAGRSGARVAASAAPGAKREPAREEAAPGARG